VSAPAIRVSGLSKRFRIGERVRYKSLRESIQNAVKAPFRRGRRAEETIWALRDVSFEVASGEVVGVIGRNGAGKSTLLKVLARITEPTEGRVELRGRVGSLLEIGTGFHMELTGRENIYLSGAILGMRRAEIERRFDEIVAFAEVERFLDTPVKHYSTGMYLRLAFAVAAHLEPEILLVDEVLAVGDAAFQKKCLGKMSDAARRERTVLFVSHNLAAVRALCGRTMLLQGGKLQAVGRSGDVIETYLSLLADPRSDGIGAEYPRSRHFRSCVARSADGSPTAQVTMGAPLALDIALRDLPDYSNVVVGASFWRSDGTKAFGFNTAMLGKVFSGRDLGNATVRCQIHALTVTPGTYQVTLSLTNGADYIEQIEDAIHITVVGDDIYGSGFLVSADFGVSYVQGDWTILGRG